MTEDQAKTKWCPQYRVATSGGDHSTFQTDNRPLEYEGKTSVLHEYARCIGQECMAWRWGVEHPDGGWIEAAPNEAVANARRKDPTYVVGGYCGLAGKP